MIENFSLEKSPRDWHKIQSGPSRYLNSYEALVGEVSTPNTDLTENIVNDLEKEITIPKSLQNQYLKALEKRAVKESVAILREMISLRQTAAAINWSGAVNDLLQRAYAQDNEHIEKPCSKVLQTRICRSMSMELASLNCGITISKIFS